MLVAAGRGERLGEDRPKAFARLGELPLLAEPLRRLDECEWIDAIVVVAPPEWEEPAILLAEELGATKVTACVPGGEHPLRVGARRARGGARRRGGDPRPRRGAAAAAARARPAAARGARRGLRRRRPGLAGRGHDQARRATGSSSRRRRATSWWPCRRRRRSSPTCCGAAAAGEGSDCASLVEARRRPRQGRRRRRAAAQGDDARRSRAGRGVAGRRSAQVTSRHLPGRRCVARPGCTVAGGRPVGRCRAAGCSSVSDIASASASTRTRSRRACRSCSAASSSTIPRGLAGHSDGDVLAHALIDALLGAAGLGDIGSLFPVGRGALPRRLVARAAHRGLRAGARRRLAARQRRLRAGRRGAADRAAPRARCAAASQEAIGEGEVNVRATTTDRLGFTGRGEGLAAQAVALLELR